MPNFYKWLIHKALIDLKLKFSILNHKTFSKLTKALQFSDWKRSCPAQNGVSITNEAECRSACSNLNDGVMSFEAKEYSDCPRCWFENSDCRWNTNSKAKEECRDTRQEVCKESFATPSKFFLLIIDKFLLCRMLSIFSQDNTLWSIDILKRGPRKRCAKSK